MFFPGLSPEKASQIKENLLPGGLIAAACLKEEGNVLCPGETEKNGGVQGGNFAQIFRSVLMSQIKNEKAAFRENELPGQFPPTPATLRKEPGEAPGGLAVSLSGKNFWVVVKEPGEEVQEQFSPAGQGNETPTFPARSGASRFHQSEEPVFLDNLARGIALQSAAEPVYFRTTLNLEKEPARREQEEPFRKENTPPLSELAIFLQGVPAGEKRGNIPAPPSAEQEAARINLAAFSGEHPVGREGLSLTQALTQDQPRDYFAQGYLFRKEENNLSSAEDKLSSPAGSGCHQGVFPTWRKGERSFSAKEVWTEKSTPGTAPEENLKPAAGPEDLPFPAVLKALFARAAKATGIPEILLEAVGQVESGLKHTHPKTGQIIRSPAGAVGIMQLLPSTALEMGLDPFSLPENILAGAKYLAQALEKFHGRIELALAGYNAGINRVQKAIQKAGEETWTAVKNLLPAETQNYVEKVMILFRSLEKMKASLPEPGAVSFRRGTPSDNLSASWLENGTSVFRESRPAGQLPTPATLRKEPGEVPGDLAVSLSGKPFLAVAKEPGEEVQEQFSPAGQENRTSTPSSRAGANRFHLPEEPVFLDNLARGIALQSAAGPVYFRTTFPGLPLLLTWLLKEKDRFLNQPGQSRPATQEVEVHLLPENLGALMVKVTWQEEKLTVHFSTPNQKTREILEASIPQLKEAIAQQNAFFKEAIIFVSHGQGEEKQARRGWSLKSKPGWQNIKAREGGLGIPADETNLAERINYWI